MTVENVNWHFTYTEDKRAVVTEVGGRVKWYVYRCYGLQGYIWVAASILERGAWA